MSKRFKFLDLRTKFIAFYLPLSINLQKKKKKKRMLKRASYMEKLYYKI